MVVRCSIHFCILRSGIRRSVIERRGKNQRQEISGGIGVYIDSSVNWEVRTRAVGKPAPQDIRVRDQARAVTAKLLFRSPAYRFYDQLANDAEESIPRGLVRDEELFGT